MPEIERSTLLSIRPKFDTKLLKGIPRQKLVAEMKTELIPFSTTVVEEPHPKGILGTATYYFLDTTLD